METAVLHISKLLSFLGKPLWSGENYYHVQFACDSVLSQECYLGRKPKIEKVYGHVNVWFHMAKHHGHCMYKGIPDSPEGILR